MANKLSILAGRTLPRFVREEYPQFLNFVKGYFEYLERKGGEYTVIADMLDSVDIDNTVEDYLFYFRNEYMPGFPESMAVDARFIIKKIKDYYSAKGTESSYEFLFRTLFDSPVEFYYPKVDMLRVSEGAWILPYYIILEKLDGQFNNPDLFALLDQKIQGLTTGATGYIDARLLLTVPKLGDPNDVFLVYGASVTELNGEFEAGEEVTVISARFDEYGNALPVIPNFRIKLAVEGGTGIIQPDGRYADTGGFISWDKKIQDSYYYQDFSYELISEIPVKFYDEVIKRLVHPAGYMMFGKVEKKSIDLISLRDLITSFSMLISWIHHVGVEMSTPTDSTTSIENNPDHARIQHTDWNHFIKFKETYQYDTFSIAEVESYTIDEMSDLTSSNFIMAFVNGRKIPSTLYSVIDDEIVFTNAPSAYVGSNTMLRQNIEIVELSYSLQDSTVFVADGSNIQYNINDYLIYTGNETVLVFVDGLLYNNQLDYNINYKTVNGIKKYNIIFIKKPSNGLVVEVFVLGDNLIAGSNYAPKVRYSGLTNNDIKFNKPFPIPHMLDDSRGESAMIFVNGRKMTNLTQYSVYYDINAKSYLVMPRVNMADLGLVAPYSIATFALKGAITNVDLDQGDGVTKSFHISANYNTINHSASARVFEHSYPPVSTSLNTFTFSRLATSDYDEWSFKTLTHGAMTNGSKVKVYFDVVINSFSIYFANYKFGIKGSLFTFPTENERFVLTPLAKTYNFNRTFIVNDVTQPLEIYLGHCAGQIKNLTLSLVDD